MAFETDFNAGNANVFLREFTYGASRFRSNTGQELELCDGAIWLDEVLILYQLKQRNPDNDTNDPDAESKWFQSKVEKRAVDQLAKSNVYLRSQKSLPQENLCGQRIELANAKPPTIHNVVIYDSSQALPMGRVLQKGRTSKRIGFVHFFHEKDYDAVIQTLYTPLEISDYLTFRAQAFATNPDVNWVPEKALVGKYLSGTGFDVVPLDEIYVDRLIDNREEFDVGRLLTNYLDRIIWGNDGLQYHLILRELAKLRRNMLKVFRDTFHWAMEKCREDILLKPSRFYFPITACSFIFIPLPAAQRENWQQNIMMYGELCKYDLRSTRCIAITVAPDLASEDHFLVNWCYRDGPWKANPEFDSMIAQSQIFREMRTELSYSYQFVNE